MEVICDRRNEDKVIAKRSVERQLAYSRMKAIHSSGKPECCLVLDARRASLPYEHPADTCLQDMFGNSVLIVWLELKLSSNTAVIAQFNSN